MCGRAEAIAQWLDADEECMLHAEEQAPPAFYGCACYGYAYPSPSPRPRPSPSPSPSPNPNPDPNLNQARALVSTWMLWLLAIATEAPPTIRIDLLLTRVGPGQAELHTLELTEAGFSLLGWRGGPPAVMGALLDACFQDTGPTAAEAALLDAYHARQLATVPPEEPSHTRFVDHCGGCHGQHTCAEDQHHQHTIHHTTAAPNGLALPDAEAEAVMYDSDDAACLRPGRSGRPRGRGRGRS